MLVSNTISVSPGIRVIIQLHNAWLPLVEHELLSYLKHLSLLQVFEWSSWFVLLNLLFSRLLFVLLVIVLSARLGYKASLISPSFSKQSDYKWPYTFNLK